MPKSKCCVSKDRCKRCPIRMLKEGTLPDGYTVKKRKLVKAAVKEGRQEEVRHEGRYPSRSGLTPTPRRHPRRSSVPAARFVEQLNAQIGNERPPTTSTSPARSTTTP